MLEIKNLSKIYKSRKYICKALNNVNIKFPSKGLVFIVGKSGSGKSTLINLIGGIDSPTSGSIILNNQDIHRDNDSFIKYRSNAIGFIFQDYCLIESMNVYDNIELGLSLKGESNHPLILKTINQVGLEEKTNTKVNLLSGGQKQRVAIARALVKNPPILLADEPTGNLDSKTSSQIFTLLQELSKEKLVIVISHNLSEAFKFGDRIIELSDGNIVKDLDRDNEYHTNQYLALINENSTITEEEISNANLLLKNSKLKIAKEKMLFKNHIDKDDENIKISNSSFKIGKNKKLLKYFIKRKLLNAFVTSLIISLLITLMGLCQSYNSLDQNKLLNDSIAQDDSPLIFRKGYFNEFQNKNDDHYFNEVTQDDITYFYSNKFDGDYYELMRYPLPLYGDFDDLALGVNTKDFSFNNGLLLDHHGYGVLSCNEEYLTDIYGIDGKLKILAGELDLNPYGIIITDYFADSLLSKNPQYISYDNLINTSEPISKRYSINAVIDTQYKIRYKTILDKFIEASKDPNNANQILSPIMNSDIAKEFLQEQKNFLGIGYTFNSHFIESSLDNPNSSCYISYFENCIFKDENNIEYISKINTGGYLDQKGLTNHSTILKDGEIVMHLNTYNQIFNENITVEQISSFKGKQITISLYHPFRKINDSPYFSKTYKIVELFTGINDDLIAFSKNDFKEIRKSTLITYGLYFANGTNNADLYLLAQDICFFNSSPYITAIQEIIGITTIFNNIFIILLLGLVIITLAILISFSYRSVKSFKRDLGIILAMGGKSTHFSIPFIIINLLIGGLASIVSTFGITYICKYVNKILVQSFFDKIGIEKLLSLELLPLSPTIFLYDYLILLAIIILSAIAPIILLKRLKVVDILRRE